MSGTLDRALAAAAQRDYGGGETRALVRLAGDADHDTGENCTTSLRRLHEAAGWSDDGGKYRTARRALDRFVQHGVVRVDVDTTGVGRLMTVCPVGAWSQVIATRSPMHRRIAARHGNRSTPDTRTSGVAARAPDPGHDDVRGERCTPDTTPDMTPDAQVSGDQGTNGPDRDSESSNPPVADAREVRRGLSESDPNEDDHSQAAILVDVTNALVAAWLNVGQAGRPPRATDVARISQGIGARAALGVARMLQAETAAGEQIDDVLALFRYRVRERRGDR